MKTDEKLSSSLVPIYMINTHESFPQSDLLRRKIQRLSKTITRFGLKNPVILQKSGQGFDLVSGHDSFQAAAMAGYCSVPATVLDVDGKVVSTN